MRVIAGTARGKVLKPVPGLDTRPTTDRVKENIFNMIQTQVRGANVLDLFAGTGQLGIEALSRGAAYADFVEHQRAAAEILRQNVEGARVADRAKIIVEEAATFLQQTVTKRYQLIFLDPPYGGKPLENALSMIETFDILDADGIIICESAAEDMWETAFPVYKSRCYGATKITLFMSAHL